MGLRLWLGPLGSGPVFGATAQCGTLHGAHRVRKHMCAFALMTQRKKMLLKKVYFGSEESERDLLQLGPRSPHCPHVLLLAQRSLEGVHSRLLIFPLVLAPRHRLCKFLRVAPFGEVYCLVFPSRRVRSLYYDFACACRLNRCDNPPSWSLPVSPVFAYFTFTEPSLPARVLPAFRSIIE